MSRRFARFSSPVFAFVFFAAVLIGCGGSNNNSAGNGNPPGSAAPGPGPVPAAPQGKFVYALLASKAEVAGFQFNNSSGALTNVSGSPFPTTQSAFAMAATPNTQWVFVSDFLQHSVTAYKADPGSGALTKAGVTALSGFQSPGMAIAPNGRFVFVFDGLNGVVGSFTINSDGTLTQIMTTSFPRGEISVAIDQSSKFLFAAADNEIVGYTIGSDGTLTQTPDSPTTVRAPINNPDKGPVGVGVAIHPQARFLFAPDSQSSNIWVYSIGSGGSLTAVSGSPFSAGQFGFGNVTTVDPSGRFLYVTGGPQVSAFKIGSDGALIPVAGSPFDNGPFRAGGAPVFQAITDPQGKFLLLADTENSEITVFSIDQSTGALTNVNGSPFKVPGFPIGGGAPTGIAMTH